MARRLRLGSKLAPLLVLAVTGCVAGADAPSPTDPHRATTTTTVPATSSTRPLEPSLADFRECMSGRGVPVPEVPLDGLGRPRMAALLGDLDTSSQAVLDALAECGGHLTTGALSLEPDPQLRGLVRDQLEEFSRCVRTEGVSDFPDPVPGFEGTGPPYRANRIPWAHPGLPAALEACRNAALRP